MSNHMTNWTSKLTTYFLESRGTVGCLSMKYNKLFFYGSIKNVLATLILCRLIPSTIHNAEQT